MGSPPFLWNHGVWNHGVWNHGSGVALLEHAGRLQQKESNFTTGLTLVRTVSRPLCFDAGPRSVASGLRDPRCLNLQHPTPHRDLCSRVGSKVDGPAGVVAAGEVCACDDRASLPSGVYMSGTSRTRPVFAPVQCNTSDGTRRPLNCTWLPLTLAIANSTGGMSLGAQARNNLVRVRGAIV